MGARPPRADSRQEMGVLWCSGGKPSAGKCGQIAGCLAVSRCGSEALGWSPGEDWCATPGGQGFCIWFSSRPKWRENCEREETRREEDRHCPSRERGSGCGGGLAGEGLFPTRHSRPGPSRLGSGARGLSLCRKGCLSSVSQTPTCSQPGADPGAVASRRKALAGSGGSSAPSRAASVQGTT